MNKNTIAVKKISKLNDLLRTTFITGKVVFTQGFQSLEEKTMQASWKET